MIELENKVIGSGGINFSGNQTLGKISWDLIHPGFQGQGWGTLLLSYRIEKLKTFPDLETILVRTSQMAYRFYEKSGFNLVQVVADYWAKEYDLYEMKFPDQVKNSHDNILK